MLQSLLLRLITFVSLHRLRTLIFLLLTQTVLQILNMNFQLLLVLALLLQPPLIQLLIVNSLILPHLRTLHRLLKETQSDYNLLLVMCCLTKQLTIGVFVLRTPLVQANSVTGLLLRVSQLIWRPQLIVGASPTVVNSREILLFVPP